MNLAYTFTASPAQPSTADQRAVRKASGPPVGSLSRAVELCFCGRAALAACAALTLLIPPLARSDILHVSSVNGNKVYRITTSGTVTAFATINVLPEGLAFATNGLLYVANDGDSAASPYTKGSSSVAAAFFHLRS